MQTRSPHHQIVPPICCPGFLIIKIAEPITIVINYLAIAGREDNVVKLGGKALSQCCLWISTVSTVDKSTVLTACKFEADSLQVPEGGREVKMTHSSSRRIESEGRGHLFAVFVNARCHYLAGRWNAIQYPSQQVQI